VAALVFFDAQREDDAPVISRPLFGDVTASVSLCEALRLQALLYAPSQHFESPVHLDKRYLTNH
jgi:hypothetical protein